MRKLLILLMSCLMLAGCANINEENLPETILSALQTIDEQEAIDDPNMSKPFYRYYLPKDIGRIKSNQLSSVFLKDGYHFVMNFDAAQIVINEYYSEDDTHHEMVDVSLTKNEADSLVYNGSFKNAFGVVHPYVCTIEKLNKKNYLLVLDIDYVKFYTITPMAELSTMIQSMFDIAKSVKYDSRKILSEFSLKNLSEEQKKIWNILMKIFRLKVI